MRIMLRHPRALCSFLGFMDLKTGVTVALLFALLNKVAGVYGLIAVFTGGSLAQLSMYLYSICALVVLAWGMRAVSDEDPKRTLYFAHMFFADHLLSTIWTVFFGVVWWVYTPHDGKRQANSQAQEDLMNAGNRTIGAAIMTDVERADAALRIWNKEKGFAAAVLVGGWCIKVYFALLLYSYAMHLRKGSYRTLPLTLLHQPPARSHGHVHYESDTSLHEDEPDDLFRASLRTPNTARRKRPTEDDALDEVLFDDDERGGASTPGGFHSRLGTEETTSSSESEEVAMARR